MKKDEPSCLEMIVIVFGLILPWVYGVAFAAIGLYEHLRWVP